MQEADVDFSLLPDAITEVQEHLPQLEADLHRLVQQPQAGELLASAFRHVHTIKGDFGYCRVTPMVELVHKIEGVMQSLRDGRFLCSALVAEAVLQSLDQVQPMLEHLQRHHRFDPDPRSHLHSLIEQLAAAGSQAQADQLARDILLSAHGAWLADPEAAVANPPSGHEPQELRRALELGQLLADGLARRLPHWQPRASLQTRWVLALNQHYRYRCDEDALRLAVLWHDVGLLAEDDALLRTPPTFKSPDWQRYAQHPERAAQWLLSAAPSASLAAQIIRQQHLWANGMGIAAPAYPLPPHPGAMMLGAADLLFERVAGLAGSEFRRAVMRTLFDINGGLETRFDAPLINAFAALAPELEPAA